MTTPPAMKRPAFYVLLAPEGADPDTVDEDDCATVHVLVHAADQLRAELEAAKLKLPGGGKGMGMHITLLWLWASMVRTGTFAGTFSEFKRRVLAFDPDKQRPEPHDDPDAEADELDPTPTGASTG